MSSHSSVIGSEPMVGGIASHVGNQNPDRKVT